MASLTAIPRLFPALWTLQASHLNTTRHQIQDRILSFLPSNLALAQVSKAWYEAIKGKTLEINWLQGPNDTYYLKSSITRSDKTAILEQTGFEIPLPPGQRTLDDFILGRGSFGVLRIGYAFRQARYVAIKTTQGDQEIEAEVEVQKKLSHLPHLLKLIDSFRRENTLFQVTELGGLGNLDEILDLLDELDLVFRERVVFCIGEDLLKGLMSMHEEGFCHLDLKVDNILLRINHSHPDLQALIIDFGCTKQSPGKEINVKEQNGDFIGFPLERWLHSFLERYSGLCDGTKIDAHAAGCVLYTLATGERKPFPPGEIQAFLAKSDERGEEVVAKEVEAYFSARLAKLLPAEASEDSLASLLRLLLEKDPKKRGSVKEALEHPWLVRMRKEAPRWEKEVKIYLRESIQASAREKKLSVLSPQDLPYAHFGAYVERKELQEELKTRLLQKVTTSYPMTVCQGTGGTGKTQLATFMLHHKEIQDHFGLKLWFRSSDQKEPLEAQHLTLARELKLIDQKASLEQALTELHRYLAEYPKRFGKPYLIIYDNADDPTLLQPYLPKEGGHLLLTTRSLEWKDPLIVDSLSPEEAEALVDKLLQRQDPATKELCQELDYSPLGLTQACAYLRNQEMEIASYLEELRQNVQVIAHDARLFGKKLPASMETLWAMTFQKLAQECPEALQLLGALADLSLDQIPKFVLDHLAKKETQDVLKKYALLAPDGRSIHRLVQLAVRSHYKEEERIKLLKKIMTAQDRSQRTLLFLAVLQGHLPLVQRLLQKGADLHITSIEKETVLHAACFYGYTAILKELLPLCPQLLEAKDHDGKTPLHKAVWGRPKPDIVELLIAHGANPNAKNSYDYTPLHWAAKHGHLESAKILLEKGGELDYSNVNGDTPLDLAIYHHQDDIFHSLLNTPKKLNPQPLSSQDLEAYYCSRLLEAKKESLFEDQILYIVKLSDHYIEISHAQNKNPTSQQNSLLKAAKFLNSALAILEKSGLSYPSLENSLFRRLEKIERYFIESQGIKAPNTLSPLKTYRMHLKTARKACEANAHNPSQALVSLTQAFKHLLKSFILEGEQILGRSPVKWAAMGMGSMARDEMCPNSDLEFGFLLKESTPEALAYFRTLSKFLQLRLINMGETSFPVFGELEPSPTPNGFCLDTGGNTPLGVEGWYELIGTPEQMAQFQSQRWMDENIILMNTLNCVSCIAGEESLINQYEKQREKVSQQAAKPFRIFSKAETLKNTLAFRLLNGHITEFEPDLSRSKEELKAFGIKKELYRPLQEILSSLAIFYNIQGKNSLGKIDALTKRGIFSATGGKNLKEALSQVLALRIKAHFFYKTEQEFLLQIEPNKPQDPTKLYLDEILLDQLQAIYRVILPFHKCVKEFAIKKEKEVFFKNAFYDESLITQGVAYEKTLQFRKAQEMFEQALALNTNDTEALLKLGSIQDAVGNSKESLERSQQVFQIVLQKYGENHPETIRSYTNIGVALDGLGKTREGFDSFQKALKIAKSLHGENHPCIADIYYHIGTLSIKLGKDQEGLGFLQEALKIQLNLYGKNHPSIVKCYSSIGSAFLKTGKTQEGLEFGQKALSLSFSLFGENHPFIAALYQNIGVCHQLIGHVQEALDFNQKALKVAFSIYGESHPIIATIYINIGTALRALGRYHESLNSYQKALQIQLPIYGENHPDIADCYRNMGALLLEDLRQVREGLDLINKALEIRLAFDGKNHVEEVSLIRAAHDYTKIGSLLYDLGRIQEGLKFDQKALNNFLKCYGENHPDVAESYNNIGMALKASGKIQEGLDFYQKALKILLSIYGEKHPKVALIYNNIGMALREIGIDLRDLKKIQEGLSFLRKAYEIFFSSYGENHFHTSGACSNIGLALQDLAVNFGKAHKNASFYKDIQEALDYAQRALKILLSIYGEKHPKVALIYNNIGSALQDLGKLQEALDYYQKALKIELDFFGESHPDIARSYNNIGSILYDMDKYEEALSFL